AGIDAEAAPNAASNDRKIRIRLHRIEEADTCPGEGALHGFDPGAESAGIDGKARCSVPLRELRNWNTADPKVAFYDLRTAECKTTVGYRVGVDVAVYRK